MAVGWGASPNTLFWVCEPSRPGCAPLRFQSDYDVSLPCCVRIVGRVGLECEPSQRSGNGHHESGVEEADVA